MRCPTVEERASLQEQLVRLVEEEGRCRRVLVRLRRELYEDVPHQQEYFQRDHQKQEHGVRQDGPQAEILMKQATERRAHHARLGPSCGAEGSNGRGELVSGGEVGGGWWREAGRQYMQQMAVQYALERVVHCIIRISNLAREVQ
jgi:hypothetical protein